MIRTLERPLQRRPTDRRPGTPSSGSRLTRWLRPRMDSAASPPRLLAWIETTAIGGFAVVVGWIVFFVHRIGDYSTESDFYGLYAMAARAIQHGAPDPSSYGIVGPDYPAAIALLDVATRDLFLAGKLVSALSAIACVLLWRRIAAHLAGPRAASWLVILLVSNAVFLHYAWSATTDMLAIGLQAAALVPMLTRRGRGAALLAGALAGVAFLTRYSSIFLLPVGIILFAVRRDAQRWRTLVAFLAGFVL